MMAESGHLGLHERIEGQRTQNFMEFSGALYIEEADVRVLARDAPEMEPLALQCLCPLVVGLLARLKRAPFGFAISPFPIIDE
jgi:hypothetical protein